MTFYDIHGIILVYSKSVGGYNMADVFKTEVSGLSESDVTPYFSINCVEENILDLNKIMKIPNSTYSVEKDLCITNGEFEWICKNWGCSSNVFNLSCENNKVIFSTLSGSPIPVLRKLSSMLNKSLIVKFASESPGEASGMYKIENGVVTSEYIPENFSNESMDIYMYLFEDYEYFYQDEDGNWHEKTEEDYEQGLGSEAIDYNYYSNYDDDYDSDYDDEDLDSLGFTEDTDMYE